MMERVSGRRKGERAWCQSEGVLVLQGVNGLPREFHEDMSMEASQVKGGTGPKHLIQNTSGRNNVAFRTSSNFR